MYFLAQLDSDEKSWGMFVSIGGCVFSIAYLVVTTELDLDTGVRYRTNFPSVHGYLPTASMTRQGLVLFGILLFVSGYLGAKLTALVTLASASVPSVVGWCTAEALVLFASRVVAEGGRWRFHVAGLDGAAMSLGCHAGFYLSMLAAPFPVLR